MGIWIIDPETGRNYITNPSAEVDQTHWNLVGSGISRSLERARFGRASIKVDTNGVVVGEGVYITSSPQWANRTFNGNIYVRGSGLVRVGVVDQVNSLSAYSEPFMLNDVRWSRIGPVPLRLGPINPTDVRIYVVTALSIQDVVFYVDGGQLEDDYYMTTYIDGDREVEDVEPHDGAPYFTWYGLKHNSVSDRSRRYRLGGRFHDVSQGLHTRLYPIGSSGLGMPPIRLNVQHFESSERSLVQGSRALPRSVTLTFWARKHPDTQVCFPASLKELHQAREALEEVVKPDRSPGAQPFLLRYLDGLDVPMDLEAYYESGLEWSGDLRYPWKNSFGVRFYCPTPYWLEDTQDQIILDASEEIAAADCEYICARIRGAWTDIAGGVDGTVKAILVHPNGLIFIGGAFTQRILVWDGVTLESLDEDIDNGEVRAIAVAPNGDIYVGGTFTLINTVAHEYIARYDVVNETWHQLEGPVNPGLSGAVNDIAVAADGTVYIAGEFLQTDAGAQMNYVCSYTIDAFAALGAGANLGLDDVAHCVEVDIDGSTVYFGGEFLDTSGGSALNLERIAKWTGAWGEMSEEGMDDIVRVLRKSIDGRVYAGGDFTVAGFADAEKIAMWNRKEWYPLGFDAEGVFGGDVYDIAVTDKGLVFAVGDFTFATGTALARRLVSWNFTRFGHWDIILPGAPIVHAIAIRPGGDIFLGFSTAGAATIASTQTFDNNGNAKTWPILDVLGPARLEFLELDWVSSIVRMDLTVGANEHVLVDFRLGKMKAVSEVRGNVIDGIMPDSDLGRTYLLPGRNRVHFLAEDTTEDTEIVLRWRLADWSFDAT